MLSPLSKTLNIAQLFLLYTKTKFSQWLWESFVHDCSVEVTASTIATHKIFSISKGFVHTCLDRDEREE